MLAKYVYSFNMQLYLHMDTHKMKAVIGSSTDSTMVYLNKFFHIRTEKTRNDQPPTIPGGSDIDELTLKLLEYKWNTTGWVWITPVDHKHFFSTPWKYYRNLLVIENERHPASSPPPEAGVRCVRFEKSKGSGIGSWEVWSIIQTFNKNQQKKSQKMNVGV